MEGKDSFAKQDAHNEDSDSSDKLKTSAPLEKRAAGPEDVTGKAAHYESKGAFTRTSVRESGIYFLNDQEAGKLKEILAQKEKGTTDRSHFQDVQLDSPSMRTLDHQEKPVLIEGDQGAAPGWPVDKAGLAKGDHVDQLFAGKENKQFNCMDYALAKATGDQTWMDRLQIGQATYIDGNMLALAGLHKVTTDVHQLHKGDLILVKTGLGMTKHAGVVEGFDRHGNPMIREKLSSESEGVYDQDFTGFTQTWAGGNTSRIEVYRK